ncbi:MAG: 4Fe-4S binding protein [Candidatus Delongbacteria bacterium]|nr:4Fe-4S binding protein [Candidatus Delongbacteria bacterium]MCG2759703.1 4Fe-4S binding protein [Candidatus Delongbacteria bacterium]
MKRQIIKIDEDKCNGCGNCIPDCPEGALQLIDGKARLISDLFCDGLGACIGNCPEGAISTEEREADAYDEAKVMENIVKAGKNTIKAHFKHLNDHGLDKYVNQAIQILTAKGIDIPEFREESCSCSSGGCPGSAPKTIHHDNKSAPATQSSGISQLRHWPVQLHLINQNDPSFDNADILICADCVPFAYADFHEKFLKGKRLVMLCPKLDQGIERYIAKLINIFQNKNIKSVSIVRMEVPCCGGIEIIVQKALEAAGVSKMIKLNVITIDGDIQ